MVRARPTISWSMWRSRPPKRANRSDAHLHGRYQQFARVCPHAWGQSGELGLTMPDHLITPVSNAGGRRALAVASGAALLLLALALAGDRMTSARAGIALDLPRLMLWAWDRDDDLRFIDTADTGVAYLAATLTLRGEDVVLTPRHNPLTLPPDVRRAAVVHVETDRGAP